MKYELQAKNGKATVPVESSGRRKRSLVGLYLLMRKTNGVVEAQSKAQHLLSPRISKATYQALNSGILAGTSSG